MDLTTLAADSGGKARIAGIVPESVVDGPGLRLVVFFQGCPHQCPHCHNPQTHDPQGGREIDLQEIVQGVAANPLLRGITISGGEPFLQAKAVGELAQRVRALGKDVLVYTGFVFEDLIARGGEALLANLDLLIDGPYLESQRDLNLAYRGSGNQRIIDVPQTLARGNVTLYKAAEKPEAIIAPG